MFQVQTESPKSDEQYINQNVSGNPRIHKRNEAGSAYPRNPRLHAGQIHRRANNYRPYSVCYYGDRPCDSVRVEDNSGGEEAGFKGGSCGGDGGRRGTGESHCSETGEARVHRGALGHQ